MNASTLRAYAAVDEDAALELWRRSWQAAYPEIDFAARLPWWRERWRGETLPHSDITIAESENGMTGFVTVDRRNSYLDQIVVAPEAWGTGIGALLIDAAKARSPMGLSLQVNQDNARAIAFYRKHGFRIAGESANAISGRPTFLMRWES